MNKFFAALFLSYFAISAPSFAAYQYGDSYSFHMSYKNALALKDGHLLILKEAEIWPNEGSEIYSGSHFSLYDPYGRVVKMDGNGSIELTFEDRFKFVEVVDFTEAANGDIWMIGNGIFEIPQSIAEAHLMSGRPEKAGLTGDENWDIISKSQESEKNHWFLGRFSNLKSGKPEFEYYYLDHIGHPVYRPSAGSAFMTKHPYLEKITEWQNGFAVTLTQDGIWEEDGKIAVLDLDRNGKLKRKPLELSIPKNDFISALDIVVNPKDPSEVFLPTHGFMKTHFVVLAAKDRLSKRASSANEAAIKSNRVGAIYDPTDARIIIYGTDWDDVGIDLEYAKIDPTKSAYNIPLMRKLNKGFGLVPVAKHLKLQRNSQGGFSVIARTETKSIADENLTIYNLDADLNISAMRKIPKVFEHDGPCRFLLGEIQMIAEHL